FRLKFADETLNNENSNDGWDITYTGGTDTVRVGGTGSETVDILGPKDLEGNQKQVSSLQTILGIDKNGDFSQDDDSAFYFYNLPKYDADGAVVGYTVDEIWVDMTDSDDPKVVENLASQYP